MSLPLCPARHALPFLTAHDCGRCPLIPVRVAKGHRLPDLIDEPGSLSFVAEGTVVRARHVDDSPPVVFDVVRAGEAFTARRDPLDDARGVTSDECRAVEGSQLCVAPRGVLVDALVQDPGAASRILELYERMADRIAAWATVRAIPGARERIVTAIRLLGGQRPRWASLGTLADITGLRRETVCRALRPTHPARLSERAPSAEHPRPTA